MIDSSARAGPVVATPPRGPPVVHNDVRKG